MVDPDYPSMSDYVDIEAINAYHELRAQGRSEEEAFEIVSSKARDNSRTPMQWDNSENAGFSAGKPWLSLGTHPSINVENEKNGEIFKFYQKMIRLRKKEDWVAKGTYEPALASHPSIYGFVRKVKGMEVLVLTNFSSKKVLFEIPESFSKAELIVNNYDVFHPDTLLAYQAVALQIKD